MEPVRWLDEREERAWRALQVMQHQLTAQLGRDLAANSGLSYSDYGVLVALTADPDGSMRVNELGCQLGWEKSRVSHQVARMEERGLVTKVRCGSDRRGAFVMITDEGRAAIAAAAPSHVAAVRRLVIDRLTPRQLDALSAAAETVLAALADEAPDPPPIAR
ncbi:MAG: MarR family winged helix-turn-helix transcriptional regulator [Acidimicrobiia bacterium]